MNCVESDVNLELATRAHSGTSWMPDKRGQAHQRDYVQHMQYVADDMAQYAKTDEQRATLAVELERYRAGYLKHLHAWLEAHSRVLSPMVTGPSKFPTRSNQKRGNTADRRLSEFVEWQKKAKAAIKRALVGPRSISSDDDEATQKFQAKIDKAEKFHEIMKAANAIIRKKNLTDAEKAEQLEKAANVSNLTAQKMLEPDFVGRAGFPPYMLQNNNANIRRMKQRIQQIETTRATPAARVDFDGGYAEEDADANRLQVFFDEKPPVEIRAKLKANGFRWAPSVGAWQRQRGENARWSLEQALAVTM